MGGQVNWLAREAFHMLLHNRVSRDVAEFHAAGKARVNFQEIVETIAILNKFEVNGAADSKGERGFPAEIFKRSRVDDLHRGARAVSGAQKFPAGHARAALAVTDYIHRDHVSGDAGLHKKFPPGHQTREIGKAAGIFHHVAALAGTSVRRLDDHGVRQGGGVCVLGKAGRDNPDGTHRLHHLIQQILVAAVPDGVIAGKAQRHPHGGEFLAVLIEKIHLQVNGRKQEGNLLLAADLI